MFIVVHFDVTSLLKIFNSSENSSCANIQVMTVHSIGKAQSNSLPNYSPMNISTVSCSYRRYTRHSFKIPTLTCDRDHEPDGRTNLPEQVWSHKRIIGCSNANKKGSIAFI